MLELSKLNIFAKVRRSFSLKVLAFTMSRQAFLGKYRFIGNPLKVYYLHPCS